MKKLIAIALFLAASSSFTASAHEGHSHKVLGTVVSITSDLIEVTTPEGKKESFVLTAKTLFKKDKTAAAAKDVAIGARVVLSMVEKDGKKSVSEVVIGAATPAPKHKKH